MATRGNKKEKASLPLWKKINGGVLTLGDGRKFKKGDTFNAKATDIPKSFRGNVMPLTPVEEIVKEEPKFFLREIVGTAEQLDDPNYKVKYDVIDVNNKVVSDKPLKKKKAEKFIADLES